MLGGGLNLLQPPDQIDDSEAQTLINFGFDQVGALVSRRGHSIRFSPGRVVAMTRALGQVWAATESAVIAEGGATVAAGGQQVGLVGYKGFLWVMTAGAQRKTDGTNDWRWIAVAPTQAPKATAEPEATVPVVDFGGGFTVDPSGDESYVSGGLQIKASKIQAYTAIKTAGGDFGTNFTLDDVFKIRVWANRWSDINSVSFDLDLNDGSFTLDYVTCTMPASEIHGGVKETVTFYIRKRPSDVATQTKDKFRYGYMNRIGQTPGKDYSTAAAVRVKVDFNDIAKVRFDSWELVGNSGNPIEGDDIAWAYTYTTDQGHESNPSPFSLPISMVRGAGDVKNLIASSDPQVTKINVYRTGGTLQQDLLVKNNTVNNGTTEYVDGNSNDDLNSLDIPLEDDHDDPPAVGGLNGPFFDRLIAFGGGKVYWSHPSKPYAFAGAALVNGDWVSPEDVVGDMMQATRRPGVMWIYGTNGVVVLQGDPGGIAAIHKASADSGVPSPQAVVQAPEGDFAFMGDGIKVFTGDSAALLSKKIDPAFQGGAFGASGAAVGYRNRKVWASDGSRTFVLDLDTSRWTEDSRVFSCFYNDASGLLGGLESGDVVQLEDGFGDNGAVIPLTYVSKSYDAGLMSDEKRWGDFEIWANTGGAVLTVTAFLTSPDQSVVLGTIESGSDTRFFFPFNANGKGIDARRCTIQITGNTAGEQVVISRMILWYYPKAREAKSFDTGEMSFGSYKMKRLREIVFDVDSPASVGVTVMSDRPEPMADRSTSMSIASMVDRRMEPIVMPQTGKIIGRLFRFVLHGSDFRPYGGKALIQEYGTYLEGAKGEYYDSDQLDFGVEWIKFLKKLEVDYEADAPATLTIETDLPGSVLTVRQTFQLPTTTDEETIILPGAQPVIGSMGLCKGRLYRIKIEPTGNFRLEAIRLWMKMIGQTTATQWGWIPLPVAQTGKAIWADVGFPPDAQG